MIFVTGAIYVPDPIINLLEESMFSLFFGIFDLFFSELFPEEPTSGPDL
jgi:hypothetical protein